MHRDQVFLEVYCAAIMGICAGSQDPRIRTMETCEDAFNVAQFAVAELTKLGYIEEGPVYPRHPASFALRPE